MSTIAPTLAAASPKRPSFHGLAFGPAEVGFQFGNRSYTCPTPPFGGIQGQVVYAITFRPNGSYAAARVSGSRNAALQSQVEGLLSRCRAEPLPSNALQVNQTTNATFRFSAN